MLKIGLTGGIGSGKSLVAKIFLTLGIPVYDADAAAKRLMASNPIIRQKIIAAFGEQAYENNQLNRAYISSIVFNTEDKLKELNAITHPVTIQDAADWFQTQQSPYAVKEAALIFESSSNTSLDYIIGVWAPLQLRIKRTLQRDGVTENQVRQRISKQMDENEKMKLCDFVLDNSGDKALLPQVYALHQKLLMLSKADT